MRKYEIVFTVEKSGAGVIRQIVQASGEYQARRIIESQYAPGRVTIISSSLVR